MQILIFTREGMKAPTFPNREGLDIKVIKFESTKLDDLMLVAKYRIINFPTSAIVDGNGNLLLKVKGQLLNAYVDRLLDK